MYDASYTSIIEIAVIKEVELDRLSLHIYRGVQVTRNANQEVLLCELVQMIRASCEEVEPGAQVFYKALSEEGLNGKNSQTLEEQQDLDGQNNAFDDPFLNLIIEELNEEMQSVSGTQDLQENEYCDYEDDVSGHNS